MNYKNNIRGISGKEDFRTKWFEDLNALQWGVPFFRHVDGKEHTHFFIDIDVKATGGTVKRDYKRYPDRLRVLCLEAAVEYFRSWVVQHSHHKFFWKVSGTGLHAIQRIDRRIDRSRLIPLILSLFPPTSEIEVEILAPKNTLHVRPLPNGTNHNPKVSDDGWCLQYDKDEKRYAFENWVRFWEHKGVIFQFTVDLRFYYNQTRIVRWAYSPYFNIPGRIYYSIPIRKWDIETILEESVSEGLNLSKYTIPDFTFKDMIAWDDTVDDNLWIQRSARTTNVIAPPVTPYQLTLYDPGEDVPMRMVHKFDEMESMFVGDVGETPPCMMGFYQRSKVKGGSHWARFQVGRYLRAFNYTPSQIANFIRFRVNDDEDNKPENQHTLAYYLPYVLGPEKDPHKVASCSVIQDPGSQFYICDEKMQERCARRHPLARRKRKKLRKPIGEVKIPPKFSGKLKESYWTKIKDLLRTAFEKNKNLVVWKATRAGVTTSMIRIALEKEKKLLVVVPTNRIGEVTFPEAIKIVEDDMKRKVNGAILASNRKGCLLLNFVEHGLQEMKEKSPEWGEHGIAWVRLRYHAKGDCQQCAHREAVISTPITSKNKASEPLYKSKILNYDQKTGYCAYITFKTQIRRFDVVFVTYSKLYSLMMSINTDNEELRDDLFDCFDIVLLDEVSTFANKSPLNLHILRHNSLITKMTETTERDIFNTLRMEMERLSEFSTTNVARDMIDYCYSFITGFEYLKMRKWKENRPEITLVQDNADNALNVIRHALSYYDRERLRSEFNKVHALFETYTRQENRRLKCMEEILLLLCEDSWVAVNTPSPDRLIDLRFISAPKTAEVKAFIRAFADPTNNKLVFATDACMPEVNLSDFFQVGFEDFIVGDPRRTNKHQLLITDTRNIGLVRFVTPRKCQEHKCDYYQNEKCELKHHFYGKNPENNWKMEARSITALYKTKCYRYQIEFLKEANAIVKMYGPENVMIVMPNIETYLWLLKRIKWGAVPRGAEVTYYRSDKTLGVPCDKRIMLCLSMPHTPVGSHLWLAHYYHKDGLLRNESLTDLEEKLRMNACKQAFWQTIGRAKAPSGDERSVVITWGISPKGLGVLFDFNKNKMKDSLPHVFMPSFRGHDERINYQVGRFWRTYGIVPEPAIIRLAQLTRSARWIGKWIKHAQIKRFGRITQPEINRIAELYDPDMFGHLGIEVEIGKWGARKTLKARNAAYEDVSDGNILIE